MFHKLVSDLPPDRLADTLPGFQITPRYLARYDEVMGSAGRQPDPPRSELWPALCGRAPGLARPSWRMPRRQGSSGCAPFTATPRSTTSCWTPPPGRPWPWWTWTRSSPAWCTMTSATACAPAAIPWEKKPRTGRRCASNRTCAGPSLPGYLSLAQDFLAENDYAYLYDAMRLMAFELGLRFFTDYLEGNVYFKVRHREHNLARALVQFKLTESIESQDRHPRLLTRGMTVYPFPDRPAHDVG